MNVNSPQFIRNPYPFYDARRSKNPAFKRNETTWTLTGYEVLKKVLAHPQIGRGNVGQKPQPDGNTEAINEIRNDNLALQIMDSWMLFQNPPDHTHSRKRIADVFTIRMIEQFEELMRTVMRQLIDNIKTNFDEDQEFDLIENLAYPYPANVICQMIGIPQEDHIKFSKWSKDFSLAIQLDFVNIKPELRTNLNHTAENIKSYFGTLIEFKKEHGGDDLMCRLIEQSQGSISDLELLANCVFLLFAGQETTTLMISNMMNALVNHPEQLELLRSQPDLAKNAVEECLRYDSSTQMIGRFALESVELAGIEINKGDHIFAFLGAAGRDPTANKDPHKFDIKRDKIKHLAFAHGAHHCLGASLARLELRVLLEETLDAFGNLAIAKPGQRRATWLMRGFDSLTMSYQRKSKLPTKPNFIKLENGLYPFNVSDLPCIYWQDYKLENVFKKITDAQRQACIEMWLKHKVIASEETALKRTDQICYLLTDTKSGDVIGVNTLYQDKLPTSSKTYFFNRMYILPEHRNSRLMIIGTAAMLCFAKHHLSDFGVAGVINVNENKKLSRPGLQRIFRRLGYRHYAWKDDKEIIIFEFDRVSYEA